MTNDEALAVVCDAANSWAEEILVWIIPGGGHEEEWQPRVDRINKALEVLGYGIEP